MDRRLKLSCAVAAPLAAVGLACAYALRPRNPPVAPRAPLAIVEHCKRAAELLYDISWAAACLKTADDSTDCTLPDALAAKVNAVLANEEARCMAAEAHTQSHASSEP
jgi:hypothetical protein